MRKREALLLATVLMSALPAAAGAAWVKVNEGEQAVFYLDSGTPAVEGGRRQA